jgi:hypothetical protein
MDATKQGVDHFETTSRDEDNDPIAPARGIVFAAVIGACMWLAIVAAIIVIIS